MRAQLTSPIPLRALMPQFFGGSSTRRTAPKQIHTPAPAGPSDGQRDSIIAAERQRIAGILQSPEAVGRTVSAHAFAFNSSMPAVKARAMLATLKTDDEAAADAFVQQILQAGSR